MDNYFTPDECSFLRESLELHRHPNEYISHCHSTDFKKMTIYSKHKDYTASKYRVNLEQLTKRVEALSEKECFEVVYCINKWIHNLNYGDEWDAGDNPQIGFKK